MSDRPSSVVARAVETGSPTPVATSRARRWRWFGLAALAAGAIVFPFIFDDYLVRVATTVMMLGIMAAAWNLIGGYAGYPSFGNAVFFGVGAYGAAVPMARFGMPFPVGLACGGLSGAALAVLVGIPVLRLRGHYFAIATLGVLGATQQIVILADKVTGGGEGLTLPLPGLALEAFNELIYLVMLAILTAVVLFTVWMSHNRLGYGLIAIRENEVAARVMGVNTTFYKVAAFSASGFFTGLAGATYAYWLSSLDPSVAFDYTYNVLLVVMAFFGGAGTVVGPLLGAAVLGVISEWLRGVLVQYHLLVFGVVIVLTVIFAPRGIVDLFARRRQLSLSSVLDNVREHSV